MLKKKKDDGIETKATPKQIKNWEELYSLFERTPMPDLDLFANFGMYMKSSALAKILFLNECKKDNKSQNEIESIYCACRHLQ